MGLLRLDKYLSDMKTGTRSQVKEYIRKGRVRIDGRIVRSPEYKVDTASQRVHLDNQEVGYTDMEYYMLNKPAGVLTATTDRHARTVLDLMNVRRKDLFPVGRLDKDTEGLLLITNDGALAHSLLSPKKHVDKVYYAKVSGIIREDTVKAFSDGLKIDDDFTAMPAVLEIMEYDEKNNLTEVNVTIREGKFHQIKRMFESVGSEVVYLKRLSMGTLQLDEALEAGEYRELTSSELEALKNIN